MQDEASGGLSNKNEFQDDVELESANQGVLEAEVPPTLTIPNLPPVNATEGVNHPCPVVTAHVSALLTTPSN